MFSTNLHMRDLILDHCRNTKDEYETWYLLRFWRRQWITDIRNSLWGYQRFSSESTIQVNRLCMPYLMFFRRRWWRSSDNHHCPGYPPHHHQLNYHYHFLPQVNLLLLYRKNLIFFFLEIREENIPRQRLRQIQEKNRLF